MTSRLQEVLGNRDTARRGSAAPPTTTTAVAAAPSAGPTSIDAAIDSLFQDVLPEMIQWSRQLDGASDPSHGYAVAQATVLRAQSLSERARLLLASSPLASRFEGGVTDLLAHLASLTRNAVARMEGFAQELGVDSFSVTVNSTPPGVSVTFTFGKG